MNKKILLSQMNAEEIDMVIESIKNIYPELFAQNLPEEMMPNVNELINDTEYQNKPTLVERSHLTIEPCDFDVPKPLKAEEIKKGYLTLLNLLKELPLDKTMTTRNGLITMLEEDINNVLKKQNETNLTKQNINKVLSQSYQYNAKV